MRISLLYNSTYIQTDRHTFHEFQLSIHACDDQSNLQHVISLKTNFMGMSKIEKIMENEHGNERTKNL